MGSLALFGRETSKLCPGDLCKFLDRKTGFFVIGEGNEAQTNGDFEMRLFDSSAVLLVVLKPDELLAEARGFSSDGAGLALCHSFEPAPPTGRGVRDAARGNKLMVIRPFEPFCNIIK